MGKPSRHSVKLLAQANKSTCPEVSVQTVPTEVKGNRWVRKPEVLSRFALSDSTLYQKISAAEFPAPCHPYGPRVSVWLESELDQHMARQLSTVGKEV